MFIHIKLWVKIIFSIHKKYLHKFRRFLFDSTPGRDKKIFSTIRKKQVGFALLLIGLFI